MLRYGSSRIISLDKLRCELQKRIMFMDGGMGTMIQALNLSEDDFRGLEIPVSLNCDDIIQLFVMFTHFEPSLQLYDKHDNEKSLSTVVMILRLYLLSKMFVA